MGQEKYGVLLDQTVDVVDWAQEPRTAKPNGSTMRVWLNGRILILWPTPEYKIGASSLTNYFVLPRVNQSVT